MKMRTLMIGATFAAVLNCASANAQVLGGNIGGAVGGTLSGGMRDMGVSGHGNAAGSLGSDLDTGSLRRSTRDTLDRTTTRARSATGAARNRAESTVSDTRDTSAKVATSAAATATQSVNTQQIDAATNVAGSIAGDASANGAQLAGAAKGATAQQSVIGNDALESGAPNLADSGRAVPQETVDAGKSSGALDGVTGNANGLASGDASAAKRGVSARGSASAEASGTSNVGTGEE